MKFMGTSTDKSYWEAFDEIEGYQTKDLLKYFKSRRPTIFPEVIRYQLNRFYKDELCSEHFYLCQE